jgi:hypothetical protein
MHAGCPYGISSDSNSFTCAGRPTSSTFARLGSQPDPRPREASLSSDLEQEQYAVGAGCSVRGRGGCR